MSGAGYRGCAAVMRGWISIMVGGAIGIGTGPAIAGPDPFVGDIISAGYTFCPRGWHEADGSILSISQYPALFALFGVTYGGDGMRTFALPDLRARVAYGTGNGPGLTPLVQGETFGSESVVLTAKELPAHTHTVNANNEDGDKPGPGDKLLAAAPPSGSGSETIYSTQPADTTMSPMMMAPSGESAPLSVQDPFVVMRYCVALEGVFPPRT